MKEKNLQNLRARALRIELRPAFSSVELFFVFFSLYLTFFEGEFCYSLLAYGTGLGR